MSLRGTRVVVLGGSSGIGLAVARGALLHGAEVLVAARGKAALEAARARDATLETATVDVTDERAVGELLARHERIDHLYFAAGAFVGGSALDGDITSFRSAIEARIWGALFAVRAAMPRMERGGSITLTGGVSTTRPAPGAFISALGTAAAEQMARALSLELAPIRVNAVSPGFTDTPMWDPILGAAKEATFASVSKKLPIERIAAAEEVAEAVLFLMSNAAITGEVVHVDGGGRLV